MREVRLVGGIDAVELKGGVLTITCDGEDLTFAVGASEAPVQRRERTPKAAVPAEAPATAPAQTHQNGAARAVGVEGAAK